MVQTNKLLNISVKYTQVKAVLAGIRLALEIGSLVGILPVGRWKNSHRAKRNNSPIISYMCHNTSKEIVTIYMS